ncbi:MAG TPA: TonB-dependent receptor [Puia sp.]|jgi:iron complex outermembrane receptor protein|nr:TonB-dependent receptor [Puia sp.]
MKSLLLFIFFSIYFFYSPAQTNQKLRFSGYLGTLSGKVLDSASGKGLPGASVYIADLKLGVTADENGDYHFANLPSGTYLVEAHAIGHSTQIKSIAITEKAVLDFSLGLQYTEESPVVITGMSKATQIKRSPVPIVTMSHVAIAENLSTNIIDAISKLPGVTQLTTGPNVSKPFIRGLGFNRILTLYDGVRQEGQQWGDEHGIEVDQYGVDHAEVIKGPASLTYGSDALAGVVNLIPTPPAPEGKIQGDVIAEFQTNNGLFGGSGMVEGTKNGFEWMGRVSHKEASNYSDRADGRVYNTAFNENDATVSLGLHRAFGYSHLNFSVFDDLQEIPDGSRDSATRQFTKQITDSDTYRPIVTNAELHSYAITPLHQHVQLYHVYSTNNFALGSGRITVNLGFERSVRREYSHPQEPDVPGLYLQLNSYVYDLKYYFPSFNGWDITTGLNGMYQQNTATNGTEFIIPSFHQFDIGPFAMVKKTFDKLDIAGGIRFDSRSFTNDPMYTVSKGIDYDVPVYGPDTTGAYQAFPYYHKIFSGYSGSLGLTYSFSNKWSAKANISRGYRSPNISEISANGVHPGTGIYQVGNPDFNPEFNVQEDIGLNFNSKIAVINFSVFYNNVSNYIFNEKILNVDGADSTREGNDVYQYRQGKAALYGGELSIDIHPIPQLHFENSVSVVYGNLLSSPGKPITDSTQYLPDIPPVHGISELQYDFTNKNLHLVNGFVKVSAAFSATQNRVYLADNTETPTPGYTLINAGVGGGFTNKQNKIVFNIYILANNIFDVIYQDHLSRLKYFEPYPNSPGPYHGIYNMGRNISFKVDFPF